MMWTTTVCVLEEKEFPTDFVIIRGNFFFFFTDEKKHSSTDFVVFQNS